MQAVLPNTGFALIMPKRRREAQALVRNGGRVLIRAITHVVSAIKQKLFYSTLPNLSK